jgi:hypothetical protein
MPDALSLYLNPVTLQPSPKQSIMGMSSPSSPEPANFELFSGFPLQPFAASVPLESPGAMRDGFSPWELPDQHGPSLYSGSSTSVPSLSSTQTAASSNASSSCSVNDSSTGSNDKNENGKGHGHGIHPAGSMGNGNGAGGSVSSDARMAAASFWPFAEAFASRTAMHVPSVPSYVTDGFERRCWQEHAREAVIVPLVSDDSDVPDCLLVLGLNSRLTYGEQYMGWIDLLRISLNALLTAVRGREADVTRATQLAQLDEAKTTFFSNASHEFRTPLTLILGPLQDCLQMQAAREPKLKDRLDIAYRNAARLKRLVDSLLDFSKLAANRLEGRFQPIALGPYTADLASLFRSVVEKAGVDVRTCFNLRRCWA